MSNLGRLRPYESRQTRDERARAELRRYLSAEQLVDYNQTGAFNVIGSDSRRYRITGAAANSVCSDRGVLLCAVPLSSIFERTLPAHQMLATKFMLEGDAKHYRKVANFDFPEVGQRRPTGYPKRTLRQKFRRFLLSLMYGIPVALFVGTVGYLFFRIITS